jgi:hypothetical protein
MPDMSKKLIARTCRVAGLAHRRHNIANFRRPGRSAAKIRDPFRSRSGIVCADEPIDPGQRLWLFRGDKNSLHRNACAEAGISGNVTSEMN